MPHTIYKGPTESLTGSEIPKMGVLATTSTAGNDPGHYGNVRGDIYASAGSVWVLGGRDLDMRSPEISRPSADDREILGDIISRPRPHNTHTEAAVE